MDERRPEGHGRETRLRVHPEEHPLGARLVLHVGVREVVRRQRVVFAVTDPGRVGGKARHEHVALELSAGGTGRGFDVTGGCPRLPVVGQVEDGVEPAVGDETGDGGQVAAVRLDVPDAGAQIVRRAPVEDGDIVAAGGQELGDAAAHEGNPANHQDAHGRNLTRPRGDNREPSSTFTWRC